MNLENLASLGHTIMLLRCIVGVCQVVITMKNYWSGVSSDLRALLKRKLNGEILKET